MRDGARQMLAAALSTSDFGPALEQFLGSSHGLSPATVTRLTGLWQDEATAFDERSLKDTDYVYVWVDGNHVLASPARDVVCHQRASKAVPPQE